MATPFLCLKNSAQSAADNIVYFLTNDPMQNQKAIVLGVSGASGMIYAVRSLKFLLNNHYNVDLVASKAAMMVWQSENDVTMPSNPRSQAQFWRDRCESGTGNLICHQWADVGATIASGSFRTLGMLVIPCSMATVAKIAHGLSSDLLERAADVHLKEGRRLVIVPRETPFNHPCRGRSANCASDSRLVSQSPKY